MEGRRADHGVWRPWAKAGDMLVTGYGGLREYTLVMGCGGLAGRGGRLVMECGRPGSGCLSSGTGGSSRYS